MAANDNLPADVAFSLHYLRTGGMGEMAAFADTAFKAGCKKVQMDPSDALALCILAAEALEPREKPERSHV